MPQRATTVVSASLILGIAWSAFAECPVVPPASRDLTVQQCSTVATVHLDRLQEWIASHRESYDQKSATALIDSYTGIVLIATTDGRSSKYFMHTREPRACDAFPAGKKVVALVWDACCDVPGSPYEVPCFIGVEETIESIVKPSPVPTVRPSAVPKRRRTTR